MLLTADQAIPDNLVLLAERARRWICDVAAPVWASRGRTDAGLFAERMTLDGVPDPAYFRTFVQARQIYSFATIGRLGWNGPWQHMVLETIATLTERARRSDGFYVHRLDADARPIDTRADLYDQAFVLLALSTAGVALEDGRWFDLAEDLLATIQANWAHPLGGFTEGEKDDPAIRRQNPHMHLLEATLALSQATGRPCFTAVAEHIAELAARRFIEADSGALLEYFSDDLMPAPDMQGRIVEPGHCFEWAWLFERIGRAGQPNAFDVADRLTAFARKHGICPTRDVCINEVFTDGSCKDSAARLWPQTERIKAAMIRYRRLGDVRDAQEAQRAFRGLERYYAVQTPGLWRDKLKFDGSWVPELAPASSLYHIACAYAELSGF